MKIFNKKFEKKGENFQQKSKKKMKIFNKNVKKKDENLTKKNVKMFK